MRKQILYYAVHYDGNWKKIEQAYLTNEYWEPMNYPCSYITIFDTQYPEQLRRLTYAPWILFYEGDITLLKECGCGVVGSRNASEYGRHVCQHVVDILKVKYTIVSGVAKGIDGVAHRSALTHHTIGVIGCGLNVIYPAEHNVLYETIKAHHLLISEYPLNSRPYAYHFPWRNRIIAALSHSIVVIEATKRSGSMLTVNEALTMDIPVYCIPHHFFDPNGIGCNLLISQGANIIIDDEDIYMI